jgi:hypothetical protein
MAEQQPAMPEMRLELVPVPVVDVDRAKASMRRPGSSSGLTAR